MKRYLNYLGTVLRNLLPVLVIFACCREVFYLMNRSLFPSVNAWTLWRLYFAGGWRFDLAAVLYANLPYLILMLLPFGFRRSALYRAVCKGLYLLSNMLFVLMELADSVYYPYTGQRTSFTVFDEFMGDDLAGIIWGETLRHWYLLLLALGFLLFLLKAYRQPSADERPYGRKDCLRHSILVPLAVFFALLGIRGHLDIYAIPMDLSEANQICRKQEEAPLVLNTSFSMVRTIGAQSMPEPEWFSPEELEAEYTPLHLPACPGTASARKNVVLFILESFSSSYSAYLSGIQGTQGEDCMPFLDSLMQQSFHCRYSYANGRVSIDAQPALSCGIPMLQGSFQVGAHSGNEVQGLPAMLREEGYATAFFHGAPRGSLGLCGFASKSGFENIYSRESFPEEDLPGSCGDWGFWDHRFLPLFRQGIGRLPEPFMAAVFTLSSHHPFEVPACAEKLPGGSLPVHRSIRYVDRVIRDFFQEARKEPWYRNTVFVFVGDHTNQTDNPAYLTLNGLFSVPVFFYTPDGSMEPGLHEGIASHTSVKPTLLHYLGIDRPYFAFGCDLLDTPAEQTFAVNYQSGTFLLSQDGYQLQFDGQKAVGLFHYAADPLMRENLLEAETERAASMERRLKAIIQQYSHRMIHNQLTLK